MRSLLHFWGHIKILRSLSHFWGHIKILRSLLHFWGHIKILRSPLYFRGQITIFEVTFIDSRSPNILIMRSTSNFRGHFIIMRSNYDWEVNFHTSLIISGFLSSNYDKRSFLHSKIRIWLKLLIFKNGYKIWFLWYPPYFQTKIDCYDFQSI